MNASFWTCIGFIVLMAALGSKLKSLLTQKLDERVDHIKEAITRATRLHQEAEQLYNQAQQQHAQAALQSQEIIHYAREEAERLKYQYTIDIQEYIQNQERLFSERMQYAELHLFEMLKGKAVQQAIEKTQQLLKSHLTDEQAENIIQRSLTEIKRRL